MSTQKEELTIDTNTNVSLEEQDKQQQAQATTETEAKVSEANNNTVSSTDDTRPEWLPEKFKNAEELAKAYGELEKKQSTPEPVAEPQPSEQTMGLDKYYEEYSENRGLSDKSYEELSKMGLDKGLVDGYIAGQEAIANNEVKMVHDMVGGEQNYSKVIEFAKSNLSEAEQSAFNETLDTGSIEQVKFAVQAIASRAGVTSDAPQQMISGDSVETESDVFESVAQVTEAMNDPRYAKDPAYRKEVEDKLARSSVI